MASRPTITRPIARSNPPAPPASPVGSPAAPAQSGIAAAASSQARSRPSRRPSAEVDLTVFTARLPEPFDPEVVRAGWGAYACWLVSAVVVRRYIDKDADEDTFVPLSQDYIDRHVPQNVRRPLIDALVAAGVLECDDRYYFGSHAGQKAGRHVGGPPGKCLCYRLGPAHRAARIRPYRVTHPELLKKLNAARRRERGEISDPTHLALRDWHDQVQILPDAPRGEHLLLDLMIEGERRFTVCAQGRVHTNVANLPREYRRYVRLARQELVSVDITASQPLLLAVLLGARAGVSVMGNPPGGEAVCPTYSDGSLSDFLRDCREGSLYDRLAGVTGYSREEVKPYFLAVVYGEPAHTHTKVGDAVRELYPGVLDAVADLYRELGHGGLPRRMQAMESRVMIGRVAGRLTREHPRMPLLTVHDSVVVPGEFIEAVEAVIAEEWMAEFRVRPRVKITAFTAPQPPRRERAAG